MADSEINVRAHAAAHTAPSSELATNKVLRNTYMLLGMTLAFSAATATAAMAIGAPLINPWITLAVFFGLLFGIHKTANSGVGLALVFLLTGFMGFTLGPILSLYLSLPNGGELVASALGTTALAFVGLSAYALATRKDFSFLSGFIMVGVMVLLGVIVASLIFDLSAFATAISAGVVLLASAIILWQTSAIIHGGETNYVLATVTLYVQIYNLFLSLLHIFGALGED